ncbi:MAG: peptidylprolyl isomerase [bacterium]
MVMKLLRKRMKIVIWVAAAAFIALIFLAWGMDVTRRSPVGMLQRGIVAKVNGRIIRVDAYRDALRRAFISARNELGGEVDGLTSTLIEDRVFDQIIQEHLLQEEIAKHGFASSDAEVISFMKNVPPQELRSDTSLMTDGEFDIEKYRQLFQNPANLPWLVEYERFVRGALPGQKLMLTLYSTVRLTDLEVGDAFSQRQAKVKLRYLLITPERASKTVELTEEEARRYYAKNAESFRMPVTAKLSYVHFPTAPTTTDSVLARQEIDEAYDELKAGAAFDNLARQVSQDRPTADKGGLVGWIRRGEVVKPFEDAAFSLRSGQISKPLLSKFGWHIVKVNSRRPDSVEVSHILIRIAASEETIDRARDAAGLFREDAATMGFEAAAVAHGVTIQETPPFSGRNDYIPTIGYSRTIRDFAFRMEPGALSRVLATQAGFYVMELTERKESHIPQFETVADTIMALAQKEKRMALAAALADSALFLLEQGKSMRQTASRLDLEYGVSREFSAASAFPDYPLELLGAATVLDTAQTSKPIKTEKGYYIVELLKKIRPDEDMFARMSSELAGNLIDTKQRRVVELWMTSLREKADVVDYRAETYR